MPFAIGDVTGDGLADCVTADPDAAQLILFPGAPDGLRAGKPFPGLVKTVDLQIADLDGDGNSELLSLSASEHTLAVSRFEDGRLTFPKPLPIHAEPLAVAVGTRQADGTNAVLACVARPIDDPSGDKLDDDDEYDDEDEDGGQKARLFIRLSAPATGDELQRWPVVDFDEEPSGLRFADVNQDGRNDLLLFSRYSPLRTFLQDERGDFSALEGRDTGSNLVRKRAPPVLLLGRRDR